MGNTEILSRGDIQLTSAGTGISHSEKCFGSTPVHFLQIWSLPTTRRLTPKYFTRHFSDAEKQDKFVRVVAPVNDTGVSTERELAKGEVGPAPVQSRLSLHASLVSPGKTVSQAIKGPKAYFHVIQTSGYNPLKSTGAKVHLKIGDQKSEFSEGDGAYISIDGGATVEVENVGENKAEVLLFDINE